MPQADSLARTATFHDTAGEASDWRLLQHKHWRLYRLLKVGLQKLANAGHTFAEDVLPELSRI